MNKSFDFKKTSVNNKDFVGGKCVVWFLRENNFLGWKIEKRLKCQ